MLRSGEFGINVRRNRYERVSAPMHGAKTWGISITIKEMYGAETCGISITRKEK